MLSSIKSIELLSNLVQGKREKMHSDTYEPQKPEMPKARRNPQPLGRTTPEEQGVPSAYLAEFYKAMSDKELASHNIMIARHGKIISSGSFKPYREDIWHITHSMCKSVTSLAVGIAIGEGYFSLDDSIYDIFPEENKFAEFLRKKDITVRQLLTMSTGVAFNELTTMIESNWIEGYMHSLEVFQPGTDFAYNSTNTFMLSAIIQEKTGMKLLEYLNEKLFHPMGIYDLFWEESPHHINKGGWGLNIWIEDVVKLGILCLNKGRWNGEQLVPEEWITEASRKQIDTPEAMNRYGYGYQFWMCERPGSYQFNGMLGQNAVMIPDLDLVIVATSGSTCLFPEGPAMKTIMKYFGGECPLSDAPLDEDKEGFASLEKVLKQLSFTGINPVSHRIYQTKGRFKGKTLVLQRALPAWGRLTAGVPKVMEQVLGRVFEMQDNTSSVIPLMLQMIHNNYSVGIRAFRFIIRDESLWLESREGDLLHRIKIGFETPLYSRVQLNGESYLVGSQGTIREDEDGNPVLYLVLSYVETTSTGVIKFFLNDEQMLVKFDEIPRIDEVAAALDVMIPVRGLRDLNPVKKMSDLKFARSEMEKTTRQRVWASCANFVAKEE
ncbi:MAG: class C beta-lactamase-related serine hydrolase [Clostridia bacterium]|nr:serine hydrolase [Lachnospiraceae bacterium]NCC02224.1 class C beta-lactamase-related serine hydrolase [Clostridia bacterium]NCD04235.1 class C beta-lactamase-related serine hydrolase [Clostridia bacterium]